MDMYSRNQYLKALREEYLKAPKKEKGRLLDEAQKRTGLNRKYLIRKLRPSNNLDRRKEERRRRKVIYDGEVRAVLAKVWEIFDYPCGQRLKPLLLTELERLLRLGEVECTAEVAAKLLQISPRTIDIKLAHQREVLRLKQNRHPQPQPLLYQKIPVKLTGEWDREEPGNLQLDFVAHCGSSAGGEFINSLSAVDIAFGWWEGEAIMGRAQVRTHAALQQIGLRFPFPLGEIHPDNDSAMINDLLWRYCEKEHIRFSRSRPNKKNDNAWVEQKNWTHVRKIFGYLRYDTEKELRIINDLYHNELRLYKNFFQPVIKLVAKERIGGRVKRRYDTPKTPYQRLMESDGIDTQTKEELGRIYHSLNPAELKRAINKKLDALYRIYCAKTESGTVHPLKKQSPRLVTKYVAQPS